MKENQKFTINLIGESIAICLENLFGSFDNEIMKYKNRVELNTNPRPGFRTKPKASNQKAITLKKISQRASHLAGRQNRVSMLYSFIALEHITLEVFNRLRNEGDKDFLKHDIAVAKNKGVWKKNKETGTIQIRDTKKEIIYLLNRKEIQTPVDCNCKNRVSNSRIQSFLTHGLKIRNTFVHGISGEKEVKLTPTGEKHVEHLDNKTRVETQEMTATTSSITVTAFSAAIAQLKQDKIFNCIHADGDPNHICASMSLSYCLYALDMCQVLAKHYHINISALFYSNENTRVIVRNSTSKLPSNQCDKEILFSTTEIRKLATTQLKLAKEHYINSIK